MTEYRLVGTAVLDGSRQRVSFNHEFDEVKVTRADFNRIFGYYCDQRGYQEPELIDWYLA